MYHMAEKNGSRMKGVSVILYSAQVDIERSLVH